MGYGGIEKGLLPAVSFAESSCGGRGRSNGQNSPSEQTAFLSFSLAAVIVAVSISRGCLSDRGFWPETSRGMMSIGCSSRLVDPPHLLRLSVCLSSFVSSFIPATASEWPRTLMTSLPLDLARTSQWGRSFDNFKVPSLRCATKREVFCKRLVRIVVISTSKQSQSLSRTIRSPIHRTEFVVERG